MAAALIAAGLQIGSALFGINAQRKAAKAEQAALRDMGIAEQEALRDLGIREKEGAEFEAGQLDKTAGQQIAASTYAMQDEIKKTALMQSRILAYAGASGAGASDASIEQVLVDVAKEGARTVQMIRYGGQEAARGLRLDAEVRRWEGQQAFEDRIAQGKQAFDGRIVQGQAVRKQSRAQTIQSILGIAGSAAGIAAQYGAAAEQDGAALPDNARSRKFGGTVRGPGKRGGLSRNR